MELFDAQRCLRCEYIWRPRYATLPKNCPKCTSPYWNKPRVFQTSNPGRVVTCLRCERSWTPIVDNPEVCPNCHSPYWSLQRKPIVNKYERVLIRAHNRVKKELRLLDEFNGDVGRVALAEGVRPKTILRRLARYEFIKKNYLAIPERLRGGTSALCDKESAQPV